MYQKLTKIVEIKKYFVNFTKEVVNPIESQEYFVENEIIKNKEKIISNTYTDFGVITKEIKNINFTPIDVFDEINLAISLDRETFIDFLVIIRNELDLEIREVSFECVLVNKNIESETGRIKYTSSKIMTNINTFGNSPSCKISFNHYSELPEKLKEVCILYPTEKEETFENCKLALIDTESIIGKRIISEILNKRKIGSSNISITFLEKTLHYDDLGILIEEDGLFNLIFPENPTADFNLVPNYVRISHKEIISNAEEIDEKYMIIFKDKIGFEDIMVGKREEIFYFRGNPKEKIRKILGKIYKSISNIKILGFVGNYYFTNKLLEIKPLNKKRRFQFPKEVLIEVPRFILIELPQ